jgi:hypothetical protein
MQFEGSFGAARELAVSLPIEERTSTVAAQHDLNTRKEGVDQPDERSDVPANLRDVPRTN